MSLLIDIQGMTEYQAACAEADEPRGFPEQDEVTRCGFAIMTETLDMVQDTGLDEIAGNLAEGMIGGVHSTILRLHKKLDAAHDEMKSLQRAFDGSEVLDVELQQTTAKARHLEAQVLALELFREAMAEQYSVITGNIWTPWRGSAPARAAEHASMIDATDAMKARKERQRADADPGDSVVCFRGAFSAKTEDDQRAVWQALDEAKAAYPAMSLAISATEGADKFAHLWAKAQGVKVVSVKYDQQRYGNRAPFVVNENMIKLAPVLVITLDHSINPIVKGKTSLAGIVKNLADKTNDENKARRGKRPPIALKELSAPKKAN